MGTPASLRSLITLFPLIPKTAARAVDDSPKR
jgi:hypothetical protein